MPGLPSLFHSLRRRGSRRFYTFWGLLRRLRNLKELIRIRGGVPFCTNARMKGQERENNPGNHPQSKSRDLSYSTDESSLKTVFSNFGQIVEVKLAKYEDTKKSRGYAFVQYSSQDDAILAMEHMDGKTIDGRTVFVEIAKPNNNRSAGYPISSGPP